MKELIFLRPEVHELIWGSEYWTISAHKCGDCMVSGGQFDGIRLSKLWKEHKEVFGNYSEDEFPLLVKVIDARDDLSIQVHPDDDYASRVENSEYGKTECWYVLDCEPEGSIVIGHKADSRECAKKLMDENRWNELIREIPIEKGSFFQITPGTVHAIRHNTKLLEIQQSCDITYRLYDYGRLQNGKPRELHTEKALDVMMIPHIDAQCYTNGVENRLVSCSRYHVEKQLICGKKSIRTEKTFAVISVVAGEIELDGRKVGIGESFIIPAKFGELEMVGDATILVTTLPKVYGAIEAGGTKMVCALGYPDGTIIDKRTIPTTTPEETTTAIIDYFKDKGIASLGIGSFGPVDVNPKSSDYGTILDTPKVAWQHYPFGKILGEALDVPVKVDTDVNASCLGEMTYGCAKGLDNVGYITIGTGIGAGIAVNGELVHGMGHPEFGHILVNRHPKDDYKGICPFHENCMEGLASGPAIEGRWGTPAKLLSDKQEVWELEADYISQGIMSMILSFSPRKIILGGGVMHQMQLFPLIREKVTEKINGYIHGHELDDIDNYIVPASLSDDQGIMGAVQLAVLAEIEN